MTGSGLGVDVLTVGDRVFLGTIGLVGLARCCL